jgi:hypothetical protein
VKTVCASLILLFSLILPHPGINHVQAAQTPTVIPRPLPTPQIPPEIAILEPGQRLSAEYGSRPPYKGPTFLKNEPLTTPDAQMVIPYLIACESHGKVEKTVDSNWYWSYGILQVQSSTAADFNAIDHTGYDPMVPFQAIDLAEIAIEHGYLARWSCASIVQIVH